MRAFDNWNSYLDNEGNLLHGKVRFCRKGTTDNVTIYNSDDIAIRNPEFTDLLGRTEYQVFIENDANVSAYFYKYIGTGDMMHWPGEDYDPSRWAYQYSSDNMDPTSAIDITSDTAKGVSTMTDLRAVNPDDVTTVNGAKLMWLYGYYNAGDTSPVLYVWDSASLDSDDGGATIMSNHIPGRGRWKLATRELHFDVRHFGIFPLDDKYSTDYSYTSQLANCAAYIDKEGLDAWFPALNDDVSYYLYDGSNTFAIKGDIYVSDAVRFQVKTGTTGTIITCHELHKRTPYLFDSSVQNGSATLTADWVNISWVGGNCMGDARVGWVIDSSSFSRVIKDKEVRFITNGSSSLQLDNCVITSNKQITGEILIQNSILKTEFFSDDYNWGNLTSINNDIRLVNCKDANTYVLLKNKQGDSNYGDLGEQTISNTTLRANCIAENAMFNNVTLAGDAELHNVSGTISMANTANSLNLIDCWLTINGNPVLTSLQLRRGSIGGNIRVLSTAYLNGADIVGSLTTSGASSVQLINCNISGNQYLGKLAQVTGCTISGDIVMYPESHTVEISGYTYSGQMFCGEFYNNIFIGNSAAIKPSPRDGADYASSLVGILCKFIGNTSNHDFVDDTAWEGVSISSRLYSQMVYQENHGGCPEEYGEITMTFPYQLLWQPEEPFDYRTIPDGIAGNSGLWIVNDWRGGSEQEIATSIYWVINFASFPLVTGNVFRLKALGNGRPYVNVINAEVRSFIRTDSYGLYCHSFDVGSPLVEARLSSPTATRAELTCVQPLRYSYTESRYYGNDDIDRHRSTLYYVTLNTRDDPTRYNASIHLRYKLN